jgi:hypothetical protein
MKTPLFLVLAVLWTTEAFLPSQQSSRSIEIALRDTKATGASIAKELQELDGKSQNNPMTHDAKGFSEHHDSLVHQLRKELWEKDKKLHATLDKLEKSLRGEEIAFDIALVEKQQLEQLEQQHESIRKLLWQATKLAGRRVRNAFKWVFRLGRSKKPQK